jgi:hypothetical protein
MNATTEQFGQKKAKYGEQLTPDDFKSAKPQTAAGFRSYRSKLVEDEKEEKNMDE